MAAFPSKKTLFNSKSDNFNYNNLHISNHSSTFTRKPESPVKSERSYILERKEKDFLNSFDAIVKELRSNNIVLKTTDICKLAAKTTAPSFYVSLETALHQYRQYKFGRSNIYDEQRRKMFAEIFVRFENLMKEAAGSMYQYTAMEIVLSQPAPSYYMTDETAVYFYYTARRKRRKRAQAS